MNKLKLSLHILAQILAQSAVVALVPTGTPEKLFAAIVAIVGVVVAAVDNVLPTA